MTFRFIHAADIHLDSPLTGLGAYSRELAECFRDASRQAFENLVKAAIEHEVDFVVIAGDIFDGDWKDYHTGNFFVKEMGRLGRAGIPVYAISGNHDAYNTMAKTLPYPDNVRFFPGDAPDTILCDKTAAAIHGQSFQDRQQNINVALKYPGPVPGRFNIGLLHTACAGDTDQDPYAPCTLEQLQNHGYDYWALGHVHNRAVLSDDPYVVFPGNIQGRHVRETGEKGFYLVEVSDLQVSRLDFVCCDVAHWVHLEIPVSRECSGLNDLMSQIGHEGEEAARQTSGKPVAVRITLSGETDLHWQLLSDPASLRVDVEAQLLGTGYEIMLEKLRIETSPPAHQSRISAEDHDLVAEFLREMDSDELMALLHQALQEDLNMLKVKVPGEASMVPDAEELAAVIKEAKGLVTARLAFGEGLTDED